jgi:hypothetical protein
MTTPVSAVLLSTTNAAGATTRQRIDLRAMTPPAEGGVLVLRIRNGPTGPTLPCVCRVMIARDQPTMPALGPEGTDGDGWIAVPSSFGGGLTANVTTPWSYRFGPETRFLQVEFSGNTGQAVSIDAVVHAYGS